MGVNESRIGWGESELNLVRKVKTRRDCSNEDNWKKMRRVG